MVFKHLHIGDTWQEMTPYLKLRLITKHKYIKNGYKCFAVYALKHIFAIFIMTGFGMRNILMMCLLALPGWAIASAQEQQDDGVDYEMRQKAAVTNDISDAVSMTGNAPYEVSPAYDGEAIDSLSLPEMDMRGHVILGAHYPYYWNGMYNWGLHKGLNVSVGASVFASFGKNAPHGVGFSQDISALYAVPLTKKLSLAVGGYLDNVNWRGGNYHDAGLTAVLGYRFDEHWEAYIYAQKSLVNNYNMPVSMYGINNVGDKVGAAVRYNFNKNFSMQVSFERDWIPDQRGRYFDQYNYPVPRP